MIETIVTEKGTTTIPMKSVERWASLPGPCCNGRCVEMQLKPGTLNELQKRIRERAGSWDGNISGKELLHRTRP